MSKRRFDISRFTKGSSDRDPNPSLAAERDKKLVRDMIGELSEMSIDEMMDALSTLESPSKPAKPSAPLKEKVSLDDVYKQFGDEAPTFSEGKGDTNSPLESMGDAGQPTFDDEQIEDALSSFLSFQPESASDSSDTDISEAPPSSHDASGISEPVDSASVVGFSGWTEEEDKRFDDEADEDDPALAVSELLDVEDHRESPISGVVRDEIVLSLLQSELVSMSQVFDAIRERQGSTELWRVLENHPDLDALEIRAAVSAQRGYAFQPYLDEAPSREFLQSMMEMLPPQDLSRFLAADLLPIQMDLDMDSARYTLIVLSSDPLERRTQSVLLSSPVQVVCRFAPQDVVTTSLADLKAWMREEGYEVEELAKKATHEAEIASHVASGVGSESVDGATVDSTSSDSDQADADQQLDSDESSEDNRRRRRRGRASRKSFDRVVKQLLADESVTDVLVAEATTEFERQEGNVALWRILADLPGVNREIVYETAARVYAFKHETIGPGRPDHDFVRLTMETLAEEHHDEMLDKLLVPFEHTIDFDTGSGRIVFVTPDPTSPDINRLIHELDLGRFELRYASEKNILRLYDELFPRKNEYLERISGDTDAFDLGMSYDDEDSLDEDALEAEISRSKLINLFEASLMEAVRQGVSDIHLFPNPNRQVEIHFRIDGRLKKWHTEDKVHPEAFLAVVKDNSTNVDRFERDSAQDGFIQRDIDGALIRFRVSILPIASANQELRAESIVIRILDDRKVLTDIKKLGMLDVALNAFNKAIRQPHGMVILTGPTGSGKSTTLVAALYQVVTPEVNVLTVEDPVEYIIKGVRQIKLSHKLDLEGALRAILRHDPDIVMVGEMRDRQTAELAIKLANTGHLTFSTLHTNDAPAAVSRLYKMGVEPFLIAYAINLVVAQRLIRVVCPKCKVLDETPDVTQMKGLGFSEEEIESGTFYKANHDKSCPTCSGSGYKGRRAVCETLYFTPAIRTMVAESGEAIDEDAIRAQAEKDGMLSLANSARVLVNMGETTAEEMMRMTSN